MLRASIHLLLAAAVVAASAFSAPSARADASSDADALIAKGIELREKGRDDEALGVFREAFAKSPSARARAQVALAEQALGMWVMAEADLVAALGSESDPWIAKNRTALEGALAVTRKHIATLEVRGAERADVFVDGVKVGSGAGPFRVEAGRRSLEVRAPGHHSTTRSIELAPGGVARETVTLVAMPAPEPAPPGARAGERDATPPAAPVKDAKVARDAGSGQRVLGWAFAGTGAALLATGGVALLVRKGIVDDYNAACPGLGAAQPASCEDLIDSSRTWQTVAIVTLVGGGVLAVGGGVLVLTAPSASPAARSPTPRGLACAPSPAAGLGGATLACAGTF